MVWASLARIARTPLPSREGGARGREPVVDEHHDAPGAHGERATERLELVERADHPAAAVEVQQQRSRAPAVRRVEPQRDWPGRTGAVQVGNLDRYRRRLVEQLDHFPELAARLLGRRHTVGRAQLPDHLAHDLGLGIHQPLTAPEAAALEQPCRIRLAQMKMLD